MAALAALHPVALRIVWRKSLSAIWRKDSELRLKSILDGKWPMAMLFISLVFTSARL